MGIQLTETYPKVVAANSRQTLYFSLCGSYAFCECGKGV